MLFSVCVLTYRLPSLFSYLLLHNKSPQNLVALNSTNLFSQNLCGSGIFYLSLWFWLGSLSCGCTQDVGEHCSHLTTLLRLENLLQRRPSDRALAGSLSSSLPIGGRLSSVPPNVCLSAGLLKCPHGMSVTSPRVIKGYRDGSHNVFYDLAFKVPLHHFCTLLLVSQVSLIWHGRGLHKCECQDTEIAVAQPGGWLWCYY